MRKFLTLFFLVILSFPSYSQELKVGVFQNPPLIYQNDEGDAAGLFIDLLEEIAQKKSWNLVYDYGSFDSLMSDLASGKIDLIPDVAKSESRDTHFLFNEIAVLPSWGQVFTVKDNIETIVDLEGETLAYVRGSYFVNDPETGLLQALKNFDIEVNLVPKERIEEVITGLETGEVDIAVLNRINGLYYMRSSEGLFNRRELRASPVIFAPVDLHFAFSFNTTESVTYIKEIDDYLKQAKKDPSSTYYKLLESQILVQNNYTVPEWISLVILVIVVGWGLLVSFNSILRRRVKLKTSQLEQAYQEIRENEQKLKLAIDNSKEGLFEWFIEEDNLYIDENFRKIMGVGKVRIEEPIETFRNVVYDQDVGLFKDSFQKYVDQGEQGHHNIEFRIKSSNGNPRWVSAQGKVYERKDDKPIRYLGTIRDIQEIKEVERSREKLLGALKERNKELKCLYQTSQLITDPSRSINETISETVQLLPDSWQYPSYTCARITYNKNSYQTDDYEKTQWSQVAPILVNEVSKGSIEVNYLKEMPEADEGPFLKEERNLIHLLSQMLGEMIERKILDEKVETIETEEQERISKELHDGVQQTLTVASINLNSLDSKLVDQKDLKTELRKGIEKVSEAINEVRNIAHDLDINYAQSVEKMIRDMKDGSNTKFQFYTNLNEDRLDHNMEKRFFRITQEAVNNILKHSNASNATIQLMKYDDLVILTIEDNGVGFDMKSHHDGFGLNGIKSRSSKMNAICTVDSSLEKGTSITIEAPLELI